MKKIIFISLLIITHTFNLNLHAEYLDGNKILKQIDENMYSKTMVTTSRMIVHGRRRSRTMRVRSWTQGDTRSFSEYLSPPKDAGTKMLKIDGKLWIYNPQVDRIIQISGHMLRQSMMGSDISYEDMMEDNETSEIYKAHTIGEEILNESDCWVLKLTAKTDDVAYHTKNIWVDKEKIIPLKEERYGKSGKLLKTTEITEIMKIDKRWYPKKFVFKDVLKKGKGTEFIIESIEFDVKIPEIRFSKAALRK